MSMRRTHHTRACHTRQVDAAPGGGSVVEHVLAVKPLVTIPAVIAPYTASIFKAQVAALLSDLQAEINKQAAAAAAGASDAAGAAAGAASGDAAADA
jgi:hypothetical protein